MTENEKSDIEIEIEKLKKVLLDSNLIKEINNSFNEVEFDYIRCLALGQPSESKASKYQLALLLILQEKFDAKISIYDPIFNELDKDILKEFKLEEEFKCDSKKVLYYLPHAPLSLMESIITNESPFYFLCNDIITHTDRLTKRKLNDLYPNLSSLVYLLGDNNNSDGFTPVINKRNRNKLKYIEPIINYNLKDKYFKTIEINRFNTKNDDWGNTFSDLSFHKLS